MIFDDTIWATKQRMNARIELLEILAEADADVKCGRVTSIKETFDDLKSLLEGEKS